MIEYAQLSVVLFTSWIITAIVWHTMDDLSASVDSLDVVGFLARLQLAAAVFFAGAAVALWIGTLS